MNFKERDLMEIEHNEAQYFSEQISIDGTLFDVEYTYDGHEYTVSEDFLAENEFLNEQEVIEAIRMDAQMGYEPC
jgi:hypothetical protein